MAATVRRCSRRSGTVGLVITMWVINQPTSPSQVVARTIAQLRNQFIIGLDATRAAQQARSVGKHNIAEHPRKLRITNR